LSNGFLIKQIICLCQTKKLYEKPDDILKLNPDAKDGVKENTVLTLPSNAKAVASFKPTLNKYEYQVQQGETLYAISKKLGISVDEMIKNNPTSKEGVAAGQMLTYFAPKKYFSTQTQPVKTEVVAKKEIPNLHTIQAEETKYSVSKKYGISIPELEELNPHIKNVFEIGMQIRLNKNTVVPKTVVADVQPTTTKTMFLFKRICMPISKTFLICGFNSSNSGIEIPYFFDTLYLVSSA
jgi:LysM repeat protein